MKKMNYSDVISNISNTINAPVKIEKQKNEAIDKLNEKHYINFLGDKI